jgi:hypothetical protein
MNENAIVNGQENGTGLDLDAFQGGAEKLVLLKPKLLALIDAEVRQFNLSVPSTLSSAIRIWQSYGEDKAKFSATFTPAGFDAEGLADFPLRTAVLWYVNVQLGQALNPKAGMPEEIISVAKPLHAKLARAALYLWESDNALGPVVRDIRQGSGYLDMAGDLTRYAVLFDDNWKNIEGRCDVVQDDTASAKKLSTLMLQSLTATPFGTIDELKDLRNRAGEYLRRGAEDIRDGASYVFRKNPAAFSRYPSLHKIQYPTTRAASKGDDTAAAATQVSAIQPAPL